MEILEGDVAGAPVGSEQPNEAVELNTVGSTGNLVAGAFGSMSNLVSVGSAGNLSRLGSGGNLTPVASVSNFMNLSSLGQRSSMGSVGNLTAFGSVGNLTQFNVKSIPSNGNLRGLNGSPPRLSRESSFVRFPAMPREDSFFQLPSLSRENSTQNFTSLKSKVALDRDESFQNLSGLNGNAQVIDFLKRPSPARLEGEDEPPAKVARGQPENQQIVAQEERVPADRVLSDQRSAKDDGREDGPSSPGGVKVEEEPPAKAAAMQSDRRDMESLAQGMGASWVAADREASNRLPVTDDVREDGPSSPGDVKIEAESEPSGDEHGRPDDDQLDEPIDVDDIHGTTAAKSRKMTADEKKLMLHKRKLRNRQSAARSREKHRRMLQDVVGQIDKLQSMSDDVFRKCDVCLRDNQSLKEENVRYQRENAKLRLDLNRLLANNGNAMGHMLGMTPWPNPVPQMQAVPAVGYSQQYDQMQAYQVQQQHQPQQQQHQSQAAQHQMGMFVASRGPTDAMMSSAAALAASQGPGFVGANGTEPYTSMSMNGMPMQHYGVVMADGRTMQARSHADKQAIAGGS